LGCGYFGVSFTFKLIKTDGGYKGESLHLRGENPQRFIVLSALESEAIKREMVNGE